MDSTTALIVVVAVLAALALAVAVGLLVRLVRTRRGLRRAGLPTGPRWVFWGALLYFVLPTDLVPDPVYLDDIGVLLLFVPLCALVLAMMAEVLRAAIKGTPPRRGSS